MSVLQKYTHLNFIFKKITPTILMRFLNKSCKQNYLNVFYFFGCRVSCPCRERRGPNNHFASVLRQYFLFGLKDSFCGGGVLLTPLPLPLC